MLIGIKKIVGNVLTEGKSGTKENCSEFTTFKRIRGRISGGFCVKKFDDELNCALGRV
jgi:hypothetical protein